MSEARVVSLPEEKLEEAVRCQVAAFVGDPIFHYFFPGEEEQRLEKMQVVFESGCRYRFITGEPVLAIELDGNIVGVANVRTPDPIEECEETNKLWEVTGEKLGQDADERFENYKVLKKKFSPEKPHHYLVSLAVEPSHQGRGLGGQLLDAVCELADDHPASEATVLDTGTDINLKFYDKHRFRRIGEGMLGEARSYWLMRNCDE